VGHSRIWLPLSHRAKLRGYLYNNCFNNSILAVTFDEATVKELFKEIEAAEGYTLNVDLAAQTITTPTGRVLRFELDQFRKEPCSKAWTISGGHSRIVMRLPLTRSAGSKRLLAL